jgi:putative membrane protein
MVNALGLLITAHLLQDGIVLEGFTPAFIAAAWLGLVNAVIRPVLMLLTLPINVLTLGLFTLVINGLMLWMVAAVVNGFALGGLLWAILAALLLSVISALISWVLRG